jgi:hypothetical protein
MRALFRRSFAFPSHMVVIAAGVSLQCETTVCPQLSLGIGARASEVACILPVEDEIKNQDFGPATLPALEKAPCPQPHIRAICARHFTRI